MIGTHKLLTPKQFSRETGIEYRFCLQKIKSGEFPSVPVGSRRRIAAQWINEWISKAANIAEIMRLNEEVQRLREDLIQERGRTEQLRDENLFLKGDLNDERKKSREIAELYQRQPSDGAIERSTVPTIEDAICLFRFERPQKKPTRWARVSLRDTGVLVIGVLHSSYGCERLHLNPMISTSMIIPVEGPIMQFLSKCRTCDSREGNRGEARPE